MLNLGALSTLMLNLGALSTIMLNLGALSRELPRIIRNDQNHDLGYKFDYIL